MGIEQPRHLHRQRAAAGQHPPPAQVLPRRPAQRQRVDARMLVEPAVFVGQQRFQVIGRDLARRHRHQGALVHPDLAGERDQLLAQIALEVELHPSLAAQRAQVAQVGGAARDRTLERLTDGLERWAHARHGRAATELSLQAGDIVIIAGKGHEATQTIGADETPFSDVEVSRELLKVAS